MRSVLKIILSMLLSVAIPIQGFAAATMRVCDAGEHAPAAASAPVSAEDPECIHYADGGATNQSGSPDAHGKCSSACCAIGALATAAAAVFGANARHAEDGAFRSAYFYRLSRAPLQRPPVSMPAIVV